jgi:dUTPase
MTKLLISLPLSDAAQKYYGSTAPTYNKVGDAGIDLPFVSDVKPYDVEVVETIGVISFETVFAMYTINQHNLAQHLINATSEQEKLDYCHYHLTHGQEFDLIASPFDIRPRSSIGKSPFRLANCVGTIDETYRGIEIAQVDVVEPFWFGDTLGCYLDYHPQLGIRGRKSHIDAGDRLLQVVAPSLDNILHIRLDFTEANCLFWSQVIGSKNRGGFGTTNANG